MKSAHSSPIWLSLELHPTAAVEVNEAAYLLASNYPIDIPHQCWEEPCHHPHPDKTYSSQLPKRQKSWSLLQFSFLSQNLLPVISSSMFLRSKNIYGLSPLGIFATSVIA